MIQPTFLSIPESAKYLGIGKSKLNALIAENAIRKVKLGRRTLISPDELQRFAESLKSAA